MTPILKSFLKRLTNLTSRNKSLLLLKDSVDQFLDLNLLDNIIGKKAYDIVKELIAEKKTIIICDEIDPRYEKVNEISKRLRRIARTEKFIEQERGSEDLYVGYPFVQGKLLDGTVIRCPLLFFPVTLKLEKQKWLLVKRDSESITFNRSLLLAYSYFNNSKISDEFLEKTFEDFNKDSLVFRTELYEFLKESPLILNFNQELFSDTLQNFDKLLKSDLDISEKNGELKLKQQAVLGIFPQAGSFLVPDYEFLIEKSDNGTSETNQENEIFTEPKNLTEIFQSKARIIDLSAVKEEKIMAPFSMDASQELAIRQINAGHSMVIQGPPGTGKSQLICNLIADFAAAGKKVLVVCQKRAALDVVYNRLNSIGFENFTALVHDFKNDRKLLFDQIADQIGLVDEYKKKNMGLDALWLEQDFNNTSRQIDKIAKELDGFKEALFDITECGSSIKNLYLNSNPNKPYISLSDSYKVFTLQKKAEFENKFRLFIKYEVKITELDSFWKSRANFKLFNQSDLTIAKNLLLNFEADSAEIRNFFQDNFNVKPNWNFIKLLKTDFISIKIMEENLDNNLIWDLVKYLYKLQNSKEVLLKINEKEQEIKNIFSNEGVELYVDDANFSAYSKYVSQAFDAQNNIISSTVYNIFSKEKTIVKTILGQYNLIYSAENLQILKGKIENKIKLVNYLNNNILLFPNLEINDLKKSNLSYFESYFSALQKAKLIVESIRKIKSINISNLFDEEYSRLKSKLIKSQKISQNYLNFESVLEKYFTVEQLNYLFENIEYTTKAAKDLDQNFDVFYEADELKATFSNTELNVVNSLLERKAENPITLFENSINLAWINHIEEKYPILRSVSSLKMEEMETDLQVKILYKQSLSQQILLIKAREHTYKGLEYNRLRNQTTYKELLHQVTKKKKLWSIRQLFKSFSEEIFDLVPCWLASPETVSAVFPMEQFFDLVIFDEASQCYAESGLPAIFRGKQSVITGDSKQLQPSDLYAVRFEDETDEQMELEVNSLLDLAIQYLPQTQLSGHYRSQSLDLIDFSNKHFYKNKLQILPHFDRINNQEANIKFIKVDGIFSENKNEIEAQKVIELVKKLNLEQPSKSIGIVTFNYRQQNLIQDLLEISPIATQNNYEPLFVKNIENVQGDERDIIIFSIGYGPDEKGKIRIQFGTLNQAGGENRLNVAITRARHQIYMITSLEARQLNVEDTLNEGPKLLKKYMEYAELISSNKYRPDIQYDGTEFEKNSLKSKLQEEDESLSNELPFADLVKKHGSIYDELLITDDNLFFQSLSAKEAHAYWPINFELKAWKFKKYYSREFWKNQEG